MTSLLTHLRRTARARLHGLQARPEARRQLQAIRSFAGSPFTRTCRPGFMRGIDFYAPAALEHALANALGAYRHRFGRYPDLTNPQLLNEKIIWFKFFGEMKVPEAGNKLLTARFLPDDAATLVKVPEIVWHSAQPTLPGNDAVAPGHYYLKASHGCNMYRRIRYPLAPDDRRALQALCRTWLAKPYGLDDGEWWYNVFPREVLLERDVCGSDGSTSWNLFVVQGEIESIALIRKPASVQRGASLKTRLDPDFRFHPDIVKSATLAAPQITPQTQQCMKTAAVAIARQFGFLRVDFLLGPDEAVYLNEITFTPGNGLLRRAESLEVGMGHKWRL